MEKSKQIIGAKNNFCIPAKSRKLINISTISSYDALLLPTSLLTLRGIDIMPQHQKANTLIHLVIINNNDFDVHIKEGDGLCESVVM